MANPLQVVSKSEYIDSKARAIFQSLLQEYRQGKIQSKTELAYRTYQAIRDFYSQIGKPGFTVRPASGPPVSADHNAMMREIQADLESLFAEVALISKALGENFVYIESDRQALQEQLTRLSEQYKELATALEDREGEISFRESFVDRSKFDVAMVEGTPAEISQEAKALVLGLLDAEEIRDGITIRILPESNGFPGNTHQVKAVSGGFRFQGEDSMHLDLQAILDGNANTWFEYETIQVPDQVITATGGLGFSYREGLSWLKPENEPLRLYLQIELDRARVLNWITMTPFLPAEKGAAPARLIRFLLEDGKGAQLDLANGSTLSEERVFLFPKMKVKRITVGLEQSTGYEIQVGHFVFHELEKAQTSIFDAGRMIPGRRVDGPKPSIENLGIQYDPATQTYRQPEVRIEDPTPDHTERAAALFTVPPTAERVQGALEAVTGYRYAIGLRDLTLSSYRFAEESVYISQPFETRDPIYRITLDAVDEIPEQFGEGNWIEYFISIDQGQTWHPIAPVGTLTPGVKTEYLIGTNTPAEGRLPHIGYLEPAEPARQVRLKIVLRRPPNTQLPDSDYFTPVVYEYRLNVATAGRERS